MSAKQAINDELQGSVLKIIIIIVVDIFKVA